MNNISKTILAAAGAVFFAAAPAVASAERVFFLVGTRHIYRIGHSQYEYVAERRQIEQDYADQVASDQAQYDQAIQGGANPDEAGPQFNQDLTDLAIKRDQQLGALYENVDFERERHPELQIEGDGPYQVMAINFHWRGDFEVFENFYVYAPWPGYVVVDRPYGWTYGMVYRPNVFVSVYGGWHRHYISEGRPVFMGGYGRHGYVHVYMRSNPQGGIYRSEGGGFHATHINGAGRPHTGQSGYGGVKPGYGGHAPNGVKPGYGGHAPNGVKPGYGGHTPSGVNPGYGGHTPSGVSTGYSGHTPSSVSPGYSGHTPSGVSPGYSGHTPSSVSPGYSGHTPSGVSPGYSGHTPSSGGPKNPTSGPRQTTPRSNTPPPSQPSGKSNSSGPKKKG